MPKEEQKEVKQEEQKEVKEVNQDNNVTEEVNNTSGIQESRIYFPKIQLANIP